MDIYRIKTTLRNSEPAIWRTIEIPADATLGALHFVLQRVMEWGEEGRFFFVVDSNSYGFAKNVHETPPLPELMPAKEMTLKEAFSKDSSFSYLYNPSTEWIQDITLLEKMEAELGVRYPRVVEGERNSPPEDVTKTHYTITMRDVAKTGLLPNDTPWIDYDPEDCNLNIYLPRMDVLESMVTQAAKKHSTPSGKDLNATRSNHRIGENNATIS